MHHYTKIESLAMILKSKKIRFNRLDQMDVLVDIVLVQAVQMGYENIWPILYRCGL